MPYDNTPPLTTGQLIQLLSQFPADTPVELTPITSAYLGASQPLAITGIGGGYDRNGQLAKEPSKPDYIVLYAYESHLLGKAIRSDEEDTD